MISDIWTILYHAYDGSGAVEKTCDAWGIQSFTINRKNMTPAGATFSIPVSQVSNELVFQKKSRIVLKRNGVRYWEGRITGPTGSIAAKSEAMQFSATDQYYFFTALPFHQTWRDHLLAEFEFARGLLFAKWDNTLIADIPIGLVGRSCGVEIASIVDSVLADLVAGHDGSDGTSDTVLMGKGTIDDGMTPQPQKLGSMTFFDAMRTVARFDTTRVTWWDYSGPDQALMQSQLAANLETVSIPFPLVSFSVAPHLEDRVPIVVIGAKNQDPGLGLPLITSFTRYQYPDPYVGSFLGGIMFSIDDTSFFGSATIAALARAIWEQGQGIGWKGELEIVETECSGLLAIGKVLNVTGGDPAWESMNAIIQSITENLATGRTKVVFGPPARLATADLMELMHPFYTSIKASSEEGREKESGKSSETNMGDKEKTKDDPSFPPKGWAKQTVWLYNPTNGTNGKWEVRDTLVTTGTPVAFDVGIARAFQLDGSGAPVPGVLMGLKFKAD